MAPPQDRSARVAVLGSSVQRSRSDRYPGRGRSPAVRRLVLALLVLAALALLTVSFRSPTSGVLHDAQGYGASALRPFQVAADRVARPFRDAYDYVSGLTSAKAQNEKLRREVRQLRGQYVDNLALATKERELEKLLHYEGGPKFPANYRPVNTAVIAYPGGPFAQQIGIAAGTHSGLALNTPVVTADGLVGRVTNAGPSTSVVTLLTDPDSAVGAKDLSSGVVGLIRHGQGGTLILDQVPKQQIVSKGDVIVTEGTQDPRYPSLYPYGIPIGTVSYVGRADIASFVTVEVRPYAAFGSLDSVAALIPKRR
ncbi:MAG: rod shape-determining protein MreC [Gaiellaceae bacterium]